MMFLSETKEYVPFEFIIQFKEAQRYLSELKAFLIDGLHSKLNVNSEYAGELKELGVVQVYIQNFSDVSNFMNDYFVY